ncbi:MAG TPA: hypothetical protein VHW23_39405 [Kofleriaceae bacterium]|nr:hypothetical protein [Kofleriaceae bacterium]
MHSRCSAFASLFTSRSTLTSEIAMTTIDDSAFTALPLTQLATVAGGCGDSGSHGGGNKHHKHHKHGKHHDSVGGDSTAQNNPLSTTMKMGSTTGTKSAQTTGLTSSLTNGQTTDQSALPTDQSALPTV